jgi:hypothetical protein
MTTRPAKLLSWSKLRVWIEAPNQHAVRELSHRRAIVALARWKAGEVPAHVTFVDVGRMRAITDPTWIDWSGFPPAPDAGA